MNTDEDPAGTIIDSRKRYMRVRAGPGTGKSYSLKKRIEKLLNEGTPPHKILVVTFTRVSALDLQRELAGMGVSGAESIRATTLHALAMRTLAMPTVRNRFLRSIRIVADFERPSMIADLMSSGRSKQSTEEMLTAYEGMWARLQEDEPRTAFEDDEQAFEHDLRGWLDFHDVMLMDEIIPRLYRFLERTPGALNSNEYEHVLVDEFQDLNKAEQGLCEMIAGNASFTIVGDEDQSIYGFKHAHPDGIRNWPIGKSDLDDVVLVDCHRCPSRVVAAANALNAAAPGPAKAALRPLPDKGLGQVHVWEHWMPTNEAGRVLIEIEGLLEKGVSPSDVLVLARDKKYGSELQRQALSSGVPLVSYLAEAATPSDPVRHRLEILTLALNVGDSLALRWLLGEGSATWKRGWFAKVRAACENGESRTPWQVLREQADGRAEYGIDKRMITRFVAIREEVQSVDTSAELEEIVDALFPEENPDFAEIRTIFQEEAGVEEDGRRVWQAIVSRVRRAVDVPEDRDQGDRVRIMTLHKSKGLSAPYTFVIGCIDGVLPNRRDADYDEERRILYVGISRVKADVDKGKPGILILNYPIRLRSGDAAGLGVAGESDPKRPGLVQPLVSPFIAEMNVPRTKTFYARDRSGPILRVPEQAVEAP